MDTRRRDSLFGAAYEQPLAEVLRPHTLSEVQGQKHLIGPGTPLRRMAEGGKLRSLIFYGPPGCGKTTVARILAENAGLRYVHVNATDTSTKEIQEALSGGGTVLYLDEIQYLNKKQQQTLLSSVEAGACVLIAATTENPFHYIYPALLSRCAAFEFKPLTAAEIRESPVWAQYRVSPDAAEAIAEHSGGDMRRALNTLELLLSTKELSGEQKEDSDEPLATCITMQDLQRLGQAQGINYDKSGDDHFNLMSALQKSLRGSDADAAVFYLAKLLEAGDLISAARRLLVCAYEDVGIASPQVPIFVTAAVEAAERVGLPEARIPLADAAILVARAPKLNTGDAAISAAAEAIRAGKGQTVPRHITNVPNSGYKYPHDYPGHWVAQQYLPDDLLGVKFVE
ncbi:MAG: replication-associated recombination protein A [Oscillospiraceae bacterium]|jgi:putative ATPase|nr:replication-associated recombination protein A [Oscillospiraceae bacterium]